MRVKGLALMEHKNPVEFHCLVLQSDSEPFEIQRLSLTVRKRILKPLSGILIQLDSYQFHAATEDLQSLINMLMLRHKSEQNAHLDKAWQQSMSSPWKPQKAIN